MAEPFLPEDNVDAVSAWLSDDANGMSLDSIDLPELSNIVQERQRALAEQEPRKAYFRLPYKTYVNPNETEIYDPLDFKTVGQKVRDNVVSAIQKRFPVVGDKYTLTIENLAYQKPEKSELLAEKDALISNGTLQDKLKGDWVLRDNATGKEIQRRNMTVINVPRMTERGTFIRNGSEHALKHMFRLRPGIYTRIKANGLIATHINPAQTTGRQATIEMDPQTGVFSLHRAGRNPGLLPLLKAAGVDDAAIKQAWGDELYNVNYEKYKRIINNPAQFKEYQTLWADDMAPVVLDAETTQRTLGKPYRKLEPQAMIDATQKMLDISRHAEGVDTDERDGLQFQRISGPADYIAERIVRDGGGLLRKTFTDIAKKGSLDDLTPAMFQPQVDSVFLEDRHSGYIEGASPMEALDFNAAVSRLGEGGIGDMRAAPKESRGVSNSYASFIDPVRSPESLAVGLVNYLAYGAKKDSNGVLYNQAYNNHSGKLETVSMNDLTDSIVAFPEFNRPDADPDEFIPVIVRGGDLDYMKRKDVDYYISSSNRLMSLGASLIALAGGVRSNRMLMGCLHPRQQLAIFRRGANWGEFTREVETIGLYRPGADDYVLAAGSEAINDFTFTPVRAIYERPYKGKLYKIKVADYGTVIVTKDHHFPVLRTISSVIDTKASDLRIGMLLPVLYVIEGSVRRDCCDHANIVSIDVVDYDGPVFDLDAGGKNFMLANGVFTHNSKYATQALPLVNRETPFVQRKLVLDDGTETTTEKFLGKYMNARFSPVAGKITSVSADNITVTDPHGVKHDIELYNNFPANQKGYIHNTPVVKVGQQVSKGEILAPSNFTDEKGGAAFGTNLTVAFMHGKNAGTFEDPFQITESAAKKLASIQLYKVKTPIEKTITYNKQRYAGMFNTKDFTPEQWDKLDDDGIVKVGTVLNEGDPIVLGVEERPPSIKGIARKAASPVQELWSHDYPGTVTGVSKRGKNIQVHIKALTPMKPGDKMCFDPTTEIMTELGWLDLDHFYEAFKKNPGIKVESMDLNGGVSEFREVTRMYCFRYTGKMYSLKTPRLDMLITPNHRVLSTYSPGTSDLHFREATSVVGISTWHLTGSDLSDMRNYACSHDDKGYTEKWEDYDGLVWCIEVDETHNMRVRRNGKAYFTGNSNYFGAKGVVSSVIPDELALKDADGNPVDVIQSAMGLISRVNASTQLGMAKLGRLAEKYGTHYELPDFIIDTTIPDLVSKELRKYGEREDGREDLYDPELNLKIPNVFVGNMYYLKLKHQADAKNGARSTGSYTSEEIPLKGGKFGSRRLGAMEVSALIGHSGNNEVLRDAKLIRGQQNDEFWRAFRDGTTPKRPEFPLVHKKFMAHLQGAGINLDERADRIHVFSATDNDVKDLTGNRKITNAATYNANTDEAVDGGLFDPKIFGADGSQWGYIELPEPVLNPMMQKSLTNILGWKDKQMEDFLTGKSNVNGKYGPKALQELASEINVTEEIKKTKDALKAENMPITKRDMLLKRLRALGSLKAEGKEPEDFFLSRVPVIPSRFRLVTDMSDDVTITADANLLYKRLMGAVDDFKEAKAAGLPDDELLDAREAVYNTLNEVIGLKETGDPKLQKKKVAGLLRWAFGKGSPKLSSLHRKVFAATTDTGGRGAMVPDNSLNMDEMGMSEKLAWTMFEPFVVRRLTQSGYTIPQAARLIIDKTPEAKQALLREMSIRPIILNRAPTLHRENLMGFYGRIRKGDALRANPQIARPFNLDFDGDSVKNMTKILFNLKALSDYSEKAELNTLKSIEPTVYLLKQIKQEDTMLIGNEVITVKGLEIAIEDLPRIDESKRTENDHTVEWDAVPGLYVETVDPATGTKVLAPITSITQHNDIDLFDVTVETSGAYKHVITCAEEHSIVAYVNGELKTVLTSESVGKCIPRIADQSLTVNDKAAGEYIKIGTKQFMSRDLGRYLGLLIGDGWISVNNNTFISADQPEIQEWCVNALNTKLSIPLSMDASVESNKTAHRVRCHLKPEASKDLSQLIGTGAENKKIPFTSLCGPKAHLIGLLEGLLSSDGSISYTKGTHRKTASKMIAYHTTSAILRDCIQLLCRKLGIRTTAHPYTGKNSKHQCYCITLALADTVSFIKQIGDFQLMCARDRKALADICADLTETATPNRYDIVPYPSHLKTQLVKAGVVGRYGVIPSTEAYRYSKNGFISRDIAACFVPELKEAFSDVPEVEAWCDLVLDKSIAWERITSVKACGKDVCWDLTVPGPNTFTLATGTVVYDTMQMHVPVSREAVNEVKNKMLPSRNLLASNNLKAQYVPSAEIAQGLYIASKVKDDQRPVQFVTQQDAWKAFKDGKIRVDTPIEILYNR